MMQLSEKGFTLIELLIVVAIIGVLASAAIQAYTDSTAKAQAAEAFYLLNGLKTPVSEQMSQNPTQCDISGSVTSGRYVKQTLAVVNVGVCELTSTFEAAGIVNANLANTTVIMTFSTITGAFNTSQASTGGTIPAKFIPNAWK